MKLYTLLILTKNTKKFKNNFNAPKKSEIVIFLGRILPCKQNKNTAHHIFPRLGRSDHSKLVWFSEDMGGHTCKTDCLPNAGPTASTCGPML